MPTSLDREALVVLKRIGGDHQDDFDRELALTPKNPSIICGRTSKKTNSSLKAAKTNALFDNAVVSRSHALFVLGPDMKVKIQDTGSLHGTSLNQKPLQSHTPVPLNSGDIIRLGAFVDRGSSTYAPYEMSANITYNPTGTPYNLQNESSTYRVPDDTEVEEISDDEDNGIWDGQKVLAENDYRPLRETIDLTGGVVSVVAKEPVAPAMESAAAEPTVDAPEPQNIDLLEDDFETTILDGEVEEERVYLEGSDDDEHSAYGDEDEGEDEDYGDEEEEDEDGDNDEDDDNCDEEDDEHGSHVYSDHSSDAGLEEEDEYEAAYGENDNKQRAVAYEYPLHNQPQIRRVLQNQGNAHRHPQVPTVLPPGSFTAENYSLSNAQARFSPIEFGRGMCHPYDQGNDYLAALDTPTYHMAPIIGCGNPLVESGNRFLSMPHNNGRHWDLSRAPSPKVDDTSAFQFQQSKEVLRETEEQAEVSSRLSIANLIDSQSNSAAAPHSKDESILPSEGEQLPQPKEEASTQVTPSKRKADDISESSLEEEVAIVANDATGAEGAKATEATSATEAVNDTDKKSDLGASKTEDKEKDEFFPINLDSQSLLPHSSEGSLAAHSACRLSVAVQSDVPRPAKRLRRAAEVFGYAAMGGVAVMSALIATAPAL